MTLRSRILEETLKSENLEDRPFFTGIYAAASTPMYKDLSCNCEELVSHCNDLMKRGCRGILLFGSTGEGPSFSVNERIDILKNVVDSGINPQRVIVGVICNGIEDAVNLVNASLEYNCSAVLIIPPYYYKNVDEAGVIAFYREVIQRVGHPDLKIFLYHIPQLSGVRITSNIIKSLLEEFPNVVIGIKESEGNLDFTKEILTTFPGFKVFVGKESQISEAVQLGAAGGISGIVNAFPELICSLYSFGIDPQKPNNNEVVQNIATTIKNYPVFPAIKHLVEKEKGQKWSVLRPPLIPLDEKQSQFLISALFQEG